MSFADHDCGGVGVRRNNARHDRGVRRPQARDAPHAQARIDDGMLVGAHRAGADAMEDAVAESAAMFEQ